MAAPGNQEHGATFGLRPGSTVVSADGEPLGTVKDATETSFKVDAEKARDYWLNRETIVACEGDSVRVGFERNRLDEYRLDSPAILSEGHADREQLDEAVSEGEAEAGWDRTQRHLKHQGGRVRGSEHYERPPQPTRGAGGNNP